MKKQFACLFFCVAAPHVFADHTVITEPLKDLASVEAELKKNGFDYGVIIEPELISDTVRIWCVRQPDATEKAVPRTEIMSSLAQRLAVPVLSWLLNPTQWLSPAQYQVWFSFEKEHWLFRLLRAPKDRLTYVTVHKKVDGFDKAGRYTR